MKSHAVTNPLGKNLAMNLPDEKPKLSSAAGFSLLELLIVLVLIGLVSVLALVGFQKSNRSFRLTEATRTLSGYLEKARIDAVRCHGGASIDLNSARSYTVNIHFGGGDTVTARTITLPEGTRLSYTLPPANTSTDPSINPITVTYDWRGRTETTILLTVADPNGGVESSSVVIGSAGDVSTDTQVTGPATVPTAQTTVSTTAGIKSLPN